MEEEAHPVHKAFEMWGWDRGYLNLDPQTAGWPAFSFYVNLLLQHAQYALGRLTGRYEDRLDFFVAHVDVSTLLVPARAVSMLAAVGVVIVGARLGHRLGGRFGALMAGMVLATSPLLIEHSIMVTPDILLTLFSVLALVRILDVWELGRWRDYVWSAVWIALGAASKYTPVLLVPCLVSAHVVRHWGDHQWRSFFDRKLLVAGAVCVAMFFVASPFTILDGVVTQRDVSAQRDHMTQGHFGNELRGAAPLFYLVNVLPAALGWPGMILGLFGLALATWRRRGGCWLILLSFACYYVVFSAFHSIHKHYILPALLPVALGLAALGEEYSRAAWAARRGRSIALAAAVFLVVLVPVGGRALQQHYRYSRPSTIQEAKAFILEELAGADVHFACELGGPVLPRDPSVEFYRRRVLLRLDADGRAALMERAFVSAWSIPMYMMDSQGANLYYDVRHYLDYDYIVVSGTASHRYRAMGEVYPRQKSFYEDLAEYCELVRHFPKSDDRRGTGVWIYRVGPSTDRILKDRGALVRGFHADHLRSIRPTDLYSFLAFTGRAAQRRESWQRADLYLSTLYEVTPLSARGPLLLTLATVKYNVGSLAAAEQLCVEALAWRPNMPRAHELRASIQRDAMKRGAAVPSVDRMGDGH